MFRKKCVPLQPISNKSSAKMGCTSAKSELSALGLHHHCTRINFDRDLAQLVAHTSGGREVAGSSPVIPTEVKSLRISRFSGFFLFIPFKAA